MRAKNATHTTSGVEIYVPPDDIWEFFMQNRQRLRAEMCCLAENTQTGYDLRLDSNDSDTYPYPVLRVFRDNKAVHEEYVFARRDMAQAMRRLALKWLCPVVEESEIPDDIPEPPADDPEYNEGDLGLLQAMIDMREEELNTAVYDFLTALLNEPIVQQKYPDDLAEEVLDSVCKILARRFKITVFRPKWVKKSDNYEHYIEYPYLDDENPGVTVAEPSSYEDAEDYLAEQEMYEAELQEGDPEDNDLSDLPAT